MSVVSISTSRWAARVAAGLLTLSAALTGSLVSADAARADDAPTMQFSADGVHWSTVYSQQLFAGVLVVPGGSATRTFWVRNDAPEEGVLRVTLANVSTDDTGLADAMTIAASTPDQPGTAVPVSAAQPCYTLSQGQLVGARDAAQVDSTIALANLGGTAGQASWVSFVLRLTFSSTDQDAPAPDTCPTDAGTVGAIPVPTTGAGSTVSAAVYHRSATGWSAGVAGSGDTATTTTPTEPVVIEPTQPSDPFQSLVANTFRFYQEWVVALWLAMLALGACILIAVRRRRHRADDRYLAYLNSFAPQNPNANPNPNTQMGTTR